MNARTNLNRKSHRPVRRGILFGIPLLLFISGITLITISSFKYISYAFYLSGLFISDEIKLDINLSDVPENGRQNDSDRLNRIDSKNAADSIAINAIKWPGLGDHFGNLIIEAASLDYPVYHGDRDEDLRKGIGHYNGSRFPGEGGNVVLVGHRNTVFKPLRDVEIGDSVTFSTTYGSYKYVISDIRITDGNDKSIVQPSDVEKLTLYTCYPFNHIGNAPKRYVVTCSLIKGTLLIDKTPTGEDKP